MAIFINYVDGVKTPTLFLFQEINNVSVTSTCCVMQRRLTSLALHILVSPRIQQQLHNVSMTAHTARCSGEHQ